MNSFDIRIVRLRKIMKIKKDSSTLLSKLQTNRCSQFLASLHIRLTILISNFKIISNTRREEGVHYTGPPKLAIHVLLFVGLKTIGINKRLRQDICNLYIY